MVGAPQDFSRTTLRPRGPSVTFTALASVLSPLPIRLRALVLKRISFAAMASSSFLENRQDVVLAQNEVFFAIELYFGARVLADEHLVAGFDRERLRLAALEDAAGAHGDDQRLERLLLGAIGNVETAGSLFFLGQSSGQNAIVERTNLHERPLSVARPCAPAVAAKGRSAPPQGAHPQAFGSLPTFTSTRLGCSSGFFGRSSEITDTNDMV